MKVLKSLGSAFQFGQSVSAGLAFKGVPLDAATTAPVPDDSD